MWCPVGPTSGRSCLFISWKLKAPQASQARKAARGSKPTRVLQARKWTDIYGIYGASYVSIHQVALHLGNMASDDDDVPGLFTLLCFSSYYWNRPFSCETIEGMVRCEGIHHTFQPNLYIFCTLWQILEQCLPLGKVVSWTTSSGYATMRLCTLPVETSILL